MKKIDYKFVGLCFISLIPTACNDGFDPTKEREEVTIGVMLPLTGSLSADGLSQKVAIEMALSDVNRAFENDGKTFRVKALIKDDRSSPAGALQALYDLFVADVRIIVGPNLSEQVHRILPFASENGVTIISPESTSPTLRKEKSDNLFRMVSDDQHQTRNLAHLIKVDGYEQLISMRRNDLYGFDFDAFLSKAFNENEGGFVFNNYSYDATTNDFGPYMIELRQDVLSINAAIPMVPSAISVAAFNEIVEILDKASVHTSLANSQWYGSDGFAMSPAITSDSVAANFAIQTGLKATAWTFDPSYQSNYDEFAAKFVAMYTQDVPNVEDALDYDAFTLAARTAESLKGVLSASQWKNQVPIVAATLIGATGPLTLDENGDRLESRYAVWKVRSNGTGGFEWFRDSILNVP